MVYRTVCLIFFLIFIYSVRLSFSHDIDIVAEEEKLDQEIRDISAEKQIDRLKKIVINARIEAKFENARAKRAEEALQEVNEKLGEVKRDKILLEKSTLIFGMRSRIEEVRDALYPGIVPIHMSTYEAWFHIMTSKEANFLKQPLILQFRNLVEERMVEVDNKHTIVSNMNIPVDVHDKDTTTFKSRNTRPTVPRPTARGKNTKVEKLDTSDQSLAVQSFLSTIRELYGHVLSDKGAHKINFYSVKIPQTMDEIKAAFESIGVVADERKLQVVKLILQPLGLPKVNLLTQDKRDSPTPNTFSNSNKKPLVNGKKEK